MANLFDTAEVKKGTKVDKNETVDIGVSYESKIKRMIAIDAEIDTLNAEYDANYEEVLIPSKEGMFKLYERTNTFPGTIKIQAGVTDFQLITKDQYAKIDDTIAEELKEEYGDDVVTDKKVFSLNPELFEKYKEEISDMIMKSTKIADEDKPKLFIATRTLTVTKGTLNKLRTPEFMKFDLRKVFEHIKPQVSIARKKDNSVK